MTQNLDVAFKDQLWLPSMKLRHDDNCHVSMESEEPVTSFNVSIPASPDLNGKVRRPGRSVQGESRTQGPAAVPFYGRARSSTTRRQVATDQGNKSCNLLRGWPASGPRLLVRAAALKGQGSLVVPERNRSISLAASRPSLMARTTRDWPLRQSPAAKTFGTDVLYSPLPAL